MAEKTPEIEVNLPDPMDGVRHFPLNIKVNDPLLKMRANHFEVAAGRSDFKIYSGWSGPNMPDKAVVNQSDQVMNNYNGEADVKLVIGATPPTQYETKGLGYQTWIAVTFWNVVFIGNSKTLDPKVIAAIPYENRVGVQNEVDKTVNWFTRTLLLMSNSTVNVAPVNLSLNLPTGYARENSYGYKPFTSIAEFGLTQGVTFWKSDDIEGYSQQFAQDSLRVGIVRVYNSSNPQLEFQKEAEYKVDKPQTFNKIPYTTVYPSQSLTGVNLFGDTTNLTAFSQKQSGIFQTTRPLSNGGTEDIEVWKTAGFYYIVSTDLKYGISFLFHRDGYGARGTGANSIQLAESQAISLLNSITLTLDMSQVQPQVKKLVKFYSSGEGINLAIIPINWSDASCNENLAYYQAIADKVKAYYSEVSYGALNLNVEVIQKDRSWINTGKSSADYHGNADLNKFWTDCIKASEMVIDYTKYDYDPANGKGVVVFVAPNKVFSSCFACSNEDQNGRFMTNKGVKVDAIYTDEHRYDLDTNTATIQCARGIIHEFCHVLGKLTVTSVQGSARDLNNWLTPDEYQIGNVPDGLSLMGINPESWTIERVHPDSYIKEWLGWLRYQNVDGNATLVIPALDKMSAGDSIYTIDYEAPNTASNFYILEYRNAAKASTWDKEVVVNGTGVTKAVIIYSVSIPSDIQKETTINTVWSMYEQGGSLNVTGKTFKDPINKLQIQPVSLVDDAAQVKVSSFKPVNLIGAVANPLSTPTIPNLEGDRLAFTLPDIDLHAYTSDGKHIGVNYQTGKYECQVPGALYSGDLIRAQEWIFVPSNVNVTFHISSKDTAAYLKEQPDEGITSGDTTYSLQVINYDSIGAKTSSQATMQTVNAGSAQAHSYTITGGIISVTSNLSTIKEILTDETNDIKITVKDTNGNLIPGASISSTTQPSGQQALSGTTQTDGSVTFNDVKPGSYTLQAVKAGLSTATGTQAVASGSTATITLTLQVPSVTTGDLKVTVKDSSGVAVSGVAVTSTTQPSGQSALSGTTGADGTATFSNVLLGSYTIQASKSGYIFTTTQGNVVAGSTFGVIMTLQAQPSGGGGGIPGFSSEAITLGILLASLLIMKKKVNYTSHFAESLRMRLALSLK